MRSLLPILFSLFAIPACLQAQTIDPPPVITDADSLVLTMQGRRGDDLPIYNGRQHMGYAGITNGFAYFESSEWQPGVLQYEGRWYPDVHLLYDLKTDEVIIRNAAGTPLNTIRERVDAFYLGNSRFIRTPNGLPSKVTFARVLAQGRVMLYSVLRKELEDKVTETQVEHNFLSSTRYFVLIDGKFHEIGKQKDIMRLLKDRKPAISASLKQNKIRWKTNPERALVHIVQTYNASAN